MQIPKLLGRLANLLHRRNYELLLRQSCQKLPSLSHMCVRSFLENLNLMMLLEQRFVKGGNKRIDRHGFDWGCLVKQIFLWFPDVYFLNDVSLSLVIVKVLFHSLSWVEHLDRSYEMLIWVLIA